MGIIDLFRRKTETRAATGYTSAILAARDTYISAASGIGELTATVQSCVSLWESAFALADVTGTDLLDRATMAMIARTVALRGEAVLLIRDRLLPCSDWDVSTRDGIPRAYRVTVSEAGGGRTETVLADEVLHFRIGSDPTAPWTGTAPLRRASITASLLHEVETALRDVYRDAPLGSQIVPIPVSTGEQFDAVKGSFRGRRGATLVVQGLASPTGLQPPSMAPDHLSPDLSRAMTGDTLDAARGAICMAFGVLPGMVNPATTGPMIREGQRHLAGWVLQPMAEVLAEEARRKLGGEILIDVGRPLQAFDAGGRARALSSLIEAMGRAKELGLSPDELSAALKAVNWGGGDMLA